jgi:hypothetical protein
LVIARFLFLAGAGTLACLAACASLAGLEDPLASDVKISPQSLTVTTSCDDAGAEAATISLENDNGGSASYTLDAPDGGPYTLLDTAGVPTSSVRGTLRPKQRVSFRLRGTGTVAGTITSDLTASVTVSGSGGAAHVVHVPVSVVVNGGQLVVFPTVVDFGEVKEQFDALPREIEITNNGTQPVHIVRFEPTDGAGSDFSIAGPTDVGAQQKATTSASFLKGDAGPPVSATFKAVLDTEACGAVPTVTLRGTRVSKEVTVEPGQIDFGEGDCNSPGGGTKTITVTNYSPKPAVFTVTPPSPNFVVSPTTDTVPAAQPGGPPQSKQITVTEGPVPATPGAYGEDITIKIVADETTTTKVAAKATSVGAILEFTPDNVKFGSNGQKSFTVKNTGNKFVYIKSKLSGGAGSFSIQSGDTNGLFVNVPGFISVKFNAVVDGLSYDATITTSRTDNPFGIPASGQVCNAIPTLSVHGTNPPPQN